MNTTAERLGMSDSHFDNPHGLDSKDHYTTARDLARLTSYALTLGEFRDIVSTYKESIPSANSQEARVLINHNKLLKMYDGCIGVKTGFTKKSGRCLVSAAKRNGITLIAVTLNASDDWNDHIEMFEYGFSVTSRKPLDSNLKGISLPVTGGAEPAVALKLSFAPEITVCETYNPNVVREIYLKKFQNKPKKTDIKSCISCR